MLNMKENNTRFRHTRLLVLLLSLLAAACAGGCATIRVTDPPRTATEQFLLTEAAAIAIDQLSTEGLRARRVYVDSAYLTQAWQTSQEHSFLLGELRSKLLMSAVQLVERREDAEIVLEVRSGGVGIDRLEYLIGIPAGTLAPFAAAGGTGAAPTVVTPELAIVKSTRQRGFATVAFVAYWADTGEMVHSSGPHLGRTSREDWWIFGYHARTTGNIPPTERE
jgi:hypothetical protein